MTSDLLPIAAVAGYLAMSYVTARVFVRWVARTYRNLPWEISDTIFCLLFSAFWPFGLPAAWLLFGPKSFVRMPTLFPFARWHEKDRRDD